VKVKLAVAFAILLLTGIAQAQTPLDYNVTGSMSVTGPSITETVDFNFQLDYPSTVPYSVGQIVGPTFVESSGPLDFTLPDQAEHVGGGYIAFVVAAGDSYDLQLGSLILPPSFDGSYLYDCASQTCASDFGVAVGQYGIYLEGTSNVTVEPMDPPDPTPEPPSQLLFGTGLLGFAAFFLLRRRLTQNQRM
jgi:MYXO-CTERM domain-containing protein